MCKHRCRKLLNVAHETYEQRWEHANLMSRYELQRGETCDQIQRKRPAMELILTNTLWIQKECIFLQFSIKVNLPLAAPHFLLYNQLYHSIILTDPISKSPPNQFWLVKLSNQSLSVWLAVYIIHRVSGFSVRGTSIIFYYLGATQV